MAIMRKLLSLLGKFIVNNEAAEQKVEEFFQQIGIKLVKKKKVAIFSERIKKSRLNRPQLLRVLKHHEQLFAALSDLVTSTDTKQWLVHNQALWQHRARAFGEAFLCIHGKGDVTTYLHIFIYHLGFFLENRYSQLEKNHDQGPSRQLLALSLRQEAHRPSAEFYAHRPHPLRVHVATATFHVRYTPHIQSEREPQFRLPGSLLGHESPNHTE